MSEEKDKLTKEQIEALEKACTDVLKQLKIVHTESKEMMDKLGLTILGYVDDLWIKIVTAFLESRK